MSITNEEPLPSVKDLASSESSLRRNALNNILSHISSRPSTSPLTPTQSLQLWRAFSVMLYMHDSKSAISVQNLIKTLASTVNLMYQKDIDSSQPSSTASQSKSKSKSKSRSRSRTSNDVAAVSEVIQSPTTPFPEYTWLFTWHTAFWTLLSQEWSGIDSHRINKYLSLVRFVLRQLFTVLFQSNASIEASQRLVDTQIEMLKSFPLNAKSAKVPDGLKLHVLDIWVEEIETAVTDARQSADLSQAEAAKDNEEKENGQSQTKKRKRLSATAAISDNTDPEAVKDTARDHEKKTIQALMAPVQALTKEAISKSVKIRAREAVTSFEESDIVQELHVNS